jgi:hypothetical protein
LLKHNLEKPKLRRVCEGMEIFFFAKKDRQAEKALIGVALD